MLEADPFRFVLHPSNAIIYSHRFRRIIIGPSLAVDAISHILHSIFCDSYLPGEDASAACLRIMLAALGRRELVPAIRAARIADGDDRMTFWTFLRRRLAVASGATFLDLDSVYRAVPQHVAAKVKHKAVQLAGVQPEAATDHLVVQARRQRRPQQDHAINIRRVEAGGEYVDVAQVLQRFGGVCAKVDLKLARPLLLAEPGNQPVSFTIGRLTADEAALNVMLFLQHPHDVLAVLDPRRKDQDRPAVTRLLDDLGAGGTHQGVLVHQVLDLASDILTAAHVQAAGVDPRLARLADQRTEIALDDQLSYSDLVADRVEEVVRAADQS